MRAGALTCHLRQIPFMGVLPLLPFPVVRGKVKTEHCGHHFEFEQSKKRKFERVRKISLQKCWLERVVAKHPSSELKWGMLRPCLPHR